MNSTTTLDAKTATKLATQPDIPGFIPVTDPERIPARRYYDEAFYKLENERVWPRAWQMACRLEEIPEAGDFIVYEILDKSVIVIRAKDGGVKAFHNACRHRGVKLAEGHGNCEVKGFQCPFHGWRWNMDGHSTFVYQPGLFSEHNTQPEDLNLPSCRVELWGGSAFINFDDSAPPLRECIEPFASDHDKRHAEKMKVEWWSSMILPANWKAAIEAFMEAYHVMRTHPQLLPARIRGESSSFSAPTTGTTSSTAQRMSAYKTTREMVDGYIEFMHTLNVGMGGGMINARDIEVAQRIRNIELPEDVTEANVEWQRRLNEEILKEGLATGRDMPDLNDLYKNGPWSTVNFCFPNYFLLPYFANMASYRVRPLGPESCLFELWALTIFPEGEERPRVVAPTPIAYDDPSIPPIPTQDYSNIPAQQLGLHANGFEYMRLSRDVEGLISHFHRVLDGYITGAPDAKLTKALRYVNTGIDSKIVDDIGL